MSVYFARVKGYVKIGFSKDPRARMQTITTSTTVKPDDVQWGDDIDLLGWIPGDRKAERALHMRFGHLHVVGEWFWDDDAYDEIIEADPRGIPSTLSGLAVWLMEEQGVARELAVRVADQVHADNIAKFESVGLPLDKAFAERLTTWYADKKATDRAYWRAQRDAA